MEDYPGNAAEREGLETWFLGLARKNLVNLRLVNHEDNFGFDFKPLSTTGGGLFSDSYLGQMEVDIRCPDSTNKAVRLDKPCRTSKLHQVLAEMEAPHEYVEQTGELTMSLMNAKTYLEAAFDKSNEYKPVNLPDPGEPDRKALRRAFRRTQGRIR